MKSKNNIGSFLEKETTIIHSITETLTEAAIEYEIASSSTAEATITAILSGSRKGKSIGVIAYLNPECECAESSAVAIIQAIGNLRSNLQQVATTIKLMIFIAKDVSVASEELRKLAYLGYTGELDSVVVINPTRNSEEENGLLSLEFFTEGNSVHGSIPQLGTNAINHMRTFLARLDELLTPEESKEEGKSYHILEYIDGGSAPNTIPDGCFAQVNIYTQPSQSHQAILEGINDIDTQLKKELSRFRLTVNVLENTQAGINLAELGPLSDRLPVIVCNNPGEYQSVIKSLL